MSEKEEVPEVDAAQTCRVNTPQFEQIISDTAKGMVPPLLDLCATSLNGALKLVGGDDPLAAEKYLHVANQLSVIAERLYDMGERSRVCAASLYADTLQKLYAEKK